MSMQLVWFKRDLRVIDHAALAAAAVRGPVLPLYIVEPGLWEQSDASARQWAFVREALVSLRVDLSRLGQPLIVRRGAAVEVLRQLLDAYPIEAVWSHQETGNGWTFARDRAVAALLRSRGIPWQQPRQHGVVRGPLDRDRWSRQWEALMGAAPRAAPGLRPLAGIRPGPLPRSPLADWTDPCRDRQRGRRADGAQLLAGFLAERGEAYHQQMSSPNTAGHGCSRLSPYLAWGLLSLREVVQATRERRAVVMALAPGARGGWGRALAAFEGRLHWHCHFIQKLETSPELEFRNLQRSMDGLRDDLPAADVRVRLAAWSRGETGWPLVDACMRALQAGGWINFRMRAMLMAVASYHLWLHWREPALHLARLFTDFEPGIHWSQAQMQSGTTGINTLRIYNPIKQGQDQDPDGVFIRRWLPELAGVGADWIHTPWKMPPSIQRQAGVRLGRDYPEPLVDHELAAREARRRIIARRQQIAAREEGRAIYAQHGSRKGPPGRRPSAGGKPAATQADLFDGAQGPGRRNR